MTTKINAFTNWLDTFVEEKGWDTEQIFEVEGESGTNLIPMQIVIDALKATSFQEQALICDKLVWLDVNNADCLGYFKHLAQALAI